jgi:hypothetical protein
MVIPSTTTLRTSNAGILASINGCIPSNVLPEGSCTRLTPLLASAPPNGIAVTMGSNGIDRTASRYGKHGNGLRSLVSNAVSRFARLILRVPSGATSIARWRTLDSAEGSQWVYDLTVRSHACYQANGILVSNSDAFRYLAVGHKTAQPKQAFSPPRYRSGGGGSGSGLDWMGL